MVKWAVTATAIMSKDGETTVIEFLTPQNQKISMKLSRNVLVWLQRQLTELMAETETSAARKDSAKK
jgi:hypothetical protein